MSHSPLLPDKDSSEPLATFGGVARGLGLAAVFIGLFVVLAAVTRYGAHLLHADLDVVIYCLFGVAAITIGALAFGKDAFGPATVPLRPGLVGPKASLLFYTGVGVGMIYLGLDRRAGLLADEAECRAQLTSAVDPHERLAVRARSPRHTVASVVDELYPFTCATVLDRPRP